jgi:hypothetical protein
VSEDELNTLNERIRTLQEENETLKREQNLRTFYLEEYKALRKQVEIMLEEEWKRAQYVVLGLAAVWVWLLTTTHDEHPVPIPRAVWWVVPAFVYFAGLLHELGAFGMVGRLSGYLRRLEKEFGVYGWERYLTEKGRQHAFAFRYVFWYGLGLAVLLFPVIFK